MSCLRRVLCVVVVCCVLVVWDVQLLASYQESLALLGLWLGVSWRYRQWQCCILHNADSMDALLADRPSTFADITVIAPKGL